MKNKRLLIILSIGVALLLIPLVGMQFSNEITWTALDFLIAAVLLFSTGLVIELVLRKVRSTEKRLILCGIILAAFLLIWAELAVGIFGSPLAGS